MSYTIQSGDTLWKIAKQNGAKGTKEIQQFINDVAKLNNIKNPDLIFAGATLKLPGDVVELGNTNPANAEVEEEPTKEELIPEEQPAKETQSTQTGAPLTTDTQTGATTGEETTLQTENDEKTIGEKAQAWNDWLDGNNADLAKFDEDVSTLGYNYAYGNISEEQYEQEFNELLAQNSEIYDRQFEYTQLVQKEDGTFDGKTFIGNGLDFAQQILDSWETDGEDGISFEEYKQAEIDRLPGQKVDQAIIDFINTDTAMIEEYDANGDDVVTAEEYIDTISQKAHAFYDLNEDGKIDKNELLSVMTSIDRQDGSHDGKITYSQFAVALDKADEIQEDAREFYEVNKNFFEQN